MGRVSCKQWWRTGGVALVAFFALVLAASAQDTGPKRYDLDVRGLALSEGLTRAARLAQLDVVFAPELVANKRTHCRARRLTGTELLACVLEGTGLEAHRLSGGAYLIRAAVRPVEAREPAPVALRPQVMTGTILGVVRDDSTNEAIVGAHVYIVGTFLGDASDAEGRFLIRHVPEGQHELQASSVGFRPAVLRRVSVTANDTVEVALGLREAPVLLSEVKIVARYDNLTHRIAYGLPVSLQSVRVAGIGIGFLVSATPEDMHGVQLSLLGNLAGNGLEGLQLSSGVNAAEKHAHGVQLGALGNQAGGPLMGVQLGGLFNASRDVATGWQAAGLSNMAWGRLNGAQVAGIANLSAERFVGFQTAGVMNVARQVAGFQVGGVLNLTHGDGYGLQAAGAFNGGSRSFKGFQVAGVVNVQQQTFTGLQAAGVVNVAGTLRGVQIGVVNVARHSRGFQLGVFNYVHDAGVALDTWTSETGLSALVLRTGGRWTPTYLGVGVLPAGDAARVAATAGFGLEIPWSRRVFSSTDLLNHAFIGRKLENQATARQMLGLRLGRKVAVLAGPAFDVLVTRRTGTHPPPLWTLASGRDGSTFWRLSLGLNAGIRLKP